MSYEFETPFESIVSAQEFLRLLAETVVEAKRDVEPDIIAEPISNLSSESKLCGSLPITRKSWTTT